MGTSSRHSAGLENLLGDSRVPTMSCGLPVMWTITKVIHYLQSDTLDAAVRWITQERTVGLTRNYQSYRLVRRGIRNRSISGETKRVGADRIGCSRQIDHPPGASEFLVQILLKLHYFNSLWIRRGLIENKLHNKSATIPFNIVWAHRNRESSIGNESVLIQLALCRFPGLAISNAKI